MKIKLPLLKFTLVLIASLVSPLSNAKSLKLAAAMEIPPYVISSDKMGSKIGLELELVKEAFVLFGYEIEFVLVPLARLAFMLKQDDIDGSLTLSRTFDLPHDVPKIYFSDPYILYKNIAVSLKKNNFIIENIKALEDKKMIAFQNASKYLGNDFKQAAELSPDYRQLAKQNLQVEMLFRERTEVLILDINIFNFYKDVNKHRTDYDLPVMIYSIFPDNYYSVGFKDPKVSNDFDRGIQQLRKSGRYDQILKKYNVKNYIEKDLLLYEE